MIPAVLKALNTWLVWRFMMVPGEHKPRKVPFYVNGGEREGKQGSPEDRALLASFDPAVATFKRDKYTGIGLACLPGNNIVALDFDNCVVDGVIDPKVSEIMYGTYAEITPSKTGVRAYFLGEMRSRKDNANKKKRVGGLPPPSPRLDGKFDIEFFGDTGFVTVTGDQTEDSKVMGWDDLAPLTDAVKTLYAERFGTGTSLAVRSNAPSGETDYDDVLSDLMPNLGWTLEEAREHLFTLDPDMSRDDWLMALMALHHEFSGDHDALDLADEWSSGGTSYVGRGDVEQRWRSFKTSPGQNPITGRWILHKEKEVKQEQKYSAEDEWVTKIAATTLVPELREKVCVNIAGDDRLDDLARANLAVVLRKAFAALGKQYPIADVRKLVKPPGKHRNAVGDHFTRPDWLGDTSTGYVYVTERDEFYRPESGEWLTVQGFNAKYDRYMQTKPDGRLEITASAFALRQARIETRARSMYVPMFKSLFEDGTVTYVNTFRPNSMPEAVDSLSDDGKRAMEIFMRHLKLFCGGRQ